jgi:hypothetical protein
VPMPMPTPPSGMLKTPVKGHAPRASVPEFPTFASKSDHPKQAFVFSRSLCPPQPTPTEAGWISSQTPSWERTSKVQILATP